jgi:hypothetical protein
MLKNLYVKTHVLKTGYYITLYNNTGNAYAYSTVQLAVRAPDCMSYLCVEGILDRPARVFHVSPPYLTCTSEP